VSEDTVQADTIAVVVPRVKAVPKAQASEAPEAVKDAALGRPT